MDRAAGRSGVVSAHYDVHPETPGADDNASGVAVLLEIVRLLRGHAPRCPIIAAFWTLKEPPYFRTAHMGSAHHARHLRRGGERLRFALSLEMLGYYSDVPGSQRYPPNFPFRVAYPSEGNFVLLLGDATSTAMTRRFKAAFKGASSTTIRSINVSRHMAGADFSDHLNFWQAGYAAFMLTDTAFLRNSHYHRSTDGPETLDYRRMSHVADGVTAALLDACADPP